MTRRQHPTPGPGRLASPRTFRPRGVAVGAALLAVPALVGMVVIGTVLLSSTAPPVDTPTALSSYQAPEPSSSAPPAAVEGIHQALHDLGNQCEPVRSDRSKVSINRDVDTILAFARRYPTGRFPIDDETGSVLSLLLVARDALRPCEPTEADRVDRALPPEFRIPKTDR